MLLTLLSHKTTSERELRFESKQSSVRVHVQTTTNNSPQVIPLMHVYTYVPGPVLSTLYTLSHRSFEVRALSSKLLCSI